MSISSSCLHAAPHSTAVISLSPGPDEFATFGPGETVAGSAPFAGGGLVPAAGLRSATSADGPAQLSDGAASAAVVR